MMTASLDRDQIIKSFDSGASDYVDKPIDREVTLARLRNQMLIKQARRELLRSEQRYTLAVRGTNDGMWDWDLSTGDLFLSSRWRTMVGINSSQWQPRGAQWMDLIHDEDRPRVIADLEAHLIGETEHFETELRMRDLQNNYRWMLCRGWAVRDVNGNASRIAGSVTDITEGKVADALTGLPNRNLFRDRVARGVEQYKRHPARRFAVIYMDIDQFKLINDHYGHDVGDKFLVQVANRLESAIRKGDAVIARLGGDEFAVLLENIRVASDVASVAERLHHQVYQPMVIGDREVLTRRSMGIVFVKDQNPKYVELLSSELLLSQADTAMDEAKKQSDRAYAFFNNDMMRETASRLELGSNLRHAITRNQMHVVYQPLVSIADQHTIGFEALLRLKHPNHGMISSATFIPIAESNGMIIELGTWVTQQACIQASEWVRKFGTQVSISVNVSTKQLAGVGFIDLIRDTLRLTKLPPACLKKLEVTESLLMQNPDETIKLLSALREQGITIGIDDFGTGYSSLAYLHQMPLDILKVDRSFVMEIETSAKQTAIVRSIIALARSLGLATVAEGAETIGQLSILAELGVDFVQGYYLSASVTADLAGQMV